MLLTKKILIAACWLSTSTLASTWSPSIAGHSLSESLAETSEIITNYMTEWAKLMTSTIDALSSQDTCTSMSGTYESLKWTWASSDSGCNVRARRTVIEMALEDYLTKSENVDRCKSCDTQCLTLDAGTFAEGWVKLGPIEKFDEDAYCGPSLTSGSSLEDDNVQLSEQQVL